MPPRLAANGARVLPPGAVAAGRTLEELERQAILVALSETGGRQDSAARVLGISTRTLIRKLKTYRSQDETEPAPAMAS